MILTKIISGGQTGADQAALRAAKEFGITTGGWMPLGYVTLDGLRPEFAELYNMKEHDSPLYPPRTRRNIIESDGTVRFAGSWNSRGELLTIKEVLAANKPSLDVDVLGSTSPQELATWLIDKNIRILNVAGNSEKTLPGIEEFVFIFLTETFTLL